QRLIVDPEAARHRLDRLARAVQEQPVQVIAGMQALVDPLEQGAEPARVVLQAVADSRRERGRGCAFHRRPSVPARTTTPTPRRVPFLSHSTEPYEALTTCIGKPSSDSLRHFTT